MANLKTANTKGKYRDAESKYDVINYILNPQAAISGYTGGMTGTPQSIANDMNDVSSSFGKTNGVQLRHFIITFSPDEMSDADTVNDIAQRIICYFSSEYQAVYNVHENKPHLHIHIVINSVSYVDGHRYYGKMNEFHSFKSFVRKILKEYGICQFDYVSNSDN